MDFSVSPVYSKKDIHIKESDREDLRHERTDTDETQFCTIVLDAPHTDASVVYPDTSLPAFGKDFSIPSSGVPEKIREMRKLYDYRDGSFALKCRNFYRQGKFMEDYEDDAPWNGSYSHYFPTYHDLNTAQLRGYFTWRARLRKGDFTPIATSIAYIYVYELLNGIGASSPEDALMKMCEFRQGFLDSGIGDPGMRRNLNRWMLEYAVLHDMPAEKAVAYAASDIVKKDSALTVLKYPEGSSDDEIFSALCFFYGNKFTQSPVLKQDDADGKRLFASVWRIASQDFSRDGMDLFTVCFGKPAAFPWHPLGNAIYFEQSAHPDSDFMLDPCRQYQCRRGMWREKRYENLYFDHDTFRALLHEADRFFRKALNTGRLLRENPNEAWASGYAEAAIRQEKEARREALKQNIAIDLSNLEKIRRDARVTQDSLLTEDYSDSDGGFQDFYHTDKHTEKAETKDTKPASDGISESLPDIPYIQVLLALIENKPAEPYLNSVHLMASVAADSINEALFDIFGDNVLESGDGSIAIVEDYRSGIKSLLKGENNG